MSALMTQKPVPEAVHWLALPAHADLPSSLLLTSGASAWQELRSNSLTSRTVSVNELTKGMEEYTTHFLLHPVDN